LIFQTFNLLEQCIHYLGDKSSLATIFISGAHGVCFTWTRLWHIKNIRCFKASNFEEESSEHLMNWWVNMRWVLLNLAICKNSGIVSLEQTINKWGSTLFEHSRWWRTSASVDMIKSERMSANLHLPVISNRSSLTVTWVFSYIPIETCRVRSQLS